MSIRECQYSRTETRSGRAVCTRQKRNFFFKCSWIWSTTLFRCRWCSLAEQLWRGRWEKSWLRFLLQRDAMSGRMNMVDDADDSGEHNSWNSVDLISWHGMYRFSIKILDLVSTTDSYNMWAGMDVASFWGCFKSGDQQDYELNILWLWIRSFSFKDTDAYEWGTWLNNCCLPLNVHR